MEVFCVCSQQPSHESHKCSLWTKCVDFLNKNKWNTHRLVRFERFCYCVRLFILVLLYLKSYLEIFSNFGDICLPYELHLELAVSVT